MLEVGERVPVTADLAYSLGATGPHSPRRDASVFAEF